MTLGLALYEELETLQSILRDDDDAGRRNSGLSVMYGEAFDITIRECHGTIPSGPGAGGAHDNLRLPKIPLIARVARDLRVLFRGTPQCSKA